MRQLDALKAYLQVRANGWEHARAIKTAGMVWSAGGFSGLGGLSGPGEYWPNTFNQLTDPWPLRSGFDPTKLGVEQFWRNSTVQSCLAFIQRTFPEARLRVMQGKGDAAKELEDHPLAQLINLPNPFYSPDRMWQETLGDWWVLGSGNAYWYKVRDLRGIPVQLWPVPAREIEPAWPKDGSEFISHYVRTVNGQKTNVAIGDVVHFRFGSDPQNRRKGYSPLMSGGAEVGVLNEGGVYRGALMANHGLPSYSLTPKDEQVAASMDPDKVESLELLWRQKFTGRNRGSLFIPNFAANLERVGFSPQELDIREMLEWDADLICALFGLSSMVLGLPSGEKHRSYANQAEAREAAMESNLVPTQALFAADLERQLLPDFDLDPNHHVGWDYSQVRVLQQDQDKLYARLDLAVATGWMTVNEARAKVNLNPIEGGDVPLPQAKAQQAAEQAQQSAEASAQQILAPNGNGRMPQGAAA